ncbi:type VI secretion system baseplate subunit TssG [Buttiauxella ferragutiae]|uniref:type VI secretion system baseplate subunit TssG n=1 Tax=Buttiauxella ferragutiae TaxID=82989 RepID=UPI001F5313A3|nr:type VI secretion system baseplate subunit TssG [Buttiauxella ferragutiae]UNK62956.1 type VI secretion system baseplate subunit TssG [Buttiauxella ferragutiae]
MALNICFSPHNFFQQVRIMLRHLTKKQGLESKQTLENNLRFISPLSLDTPSGEIGEIEQLAKNQWQVEVAAFGLTGALGALPTVYTEWLIERHYRYGDKTAKAFLDIFNHRLHTLRYLAWQKYHYYAMAEFSATLPLSDAVQALAGVMQSPSSFQQLRYADLFAHSVRSMLNLETWLKHSFSVPAKITPFTGEWRSMEPTLCCCLGQPSQTLGSAPMLGRVYWDRQSHFTVSLGPVPLRDVGLFLSKGRHYKNLWTHIRDYVGAGLDFDIDILIQNTSNGMTELGTGQIGLDICLGRASEAGQHTIRLPVYREGK